jgi:hypothetical protein
MSKKLIYFISAVTVLGLAGYVSTAEADAEIAVASVAFGKPILDGVMDDVWFLSTEQFITVTKEGTPTTSPADCSGSWWALWDSEYLYVLVDVDDEALVQDSDPDTGWYDDRIEIFIDGDNSKDSAPDGKNDYQYNFRWNFGKVERPVEWYFDASGVPHPAGSSIEGVEYVVVTTDDGYLFEVALPWSTMTRELPQEGQLIGIDVSIDDDDDGGGRDAMLSWYHTGPTTPHTPALWGTASLVVISSEGAYCPNPSDGRKDVPRDAILKWLAGDYADTHDVYLGTVFDDVNDASRDNDPNGVLVSRGQYETTYDPPGLLEFGQTYYWRVDEINDLNPNSPWRGSVASFTIIDHFIVDDFESYNDFDPSDPNSNRIFNTWVDGYEQPENGAIVGYADPPFAERNIIYGGKQSMPYYYDNAGTATYSQAQRTFSPGQDWTREGVGILSLWFRGYPPYVGSFVEAPAGTYTMTGAGADIWATADEFHFAYKELSGAGAIIAKVESVGNTDPWAKAGVMIRDTLEPGSIYVAVLVTPENGVRFQRRTNAGRVTDRYFALDITAPQWVRLERTVGGLVRAYYSADGTTWTSFSLVQVRMSMPVYIGLAVTSHNVDATCEAKFSNVSFPNTSVDPQWTDQDVGMLCNKAEPMYVAVEDGSGTAATVYHDNSDAALTSTWTQWNIDLTEFGDAGVVLTDVSKLAIGFGDKNNPQAGGSGLMYFDDIRLYLPPIE